jgi:hypothetical protein
MGGFGGAREGLHFAQDTATKGGLAAWPHGRRSLGLRARGGRDRPTGLVWEPLAFAARLAPWQPARRVRHDRPPQGGSEVPVPAVFGSVSSHRPPLRRESEHCTVRVWAAKSRSAHPSASVSLGQSPVVSIRHHSGHQGVGLQLGER